MKTSSLLASAVLCSALSAASAQTAPPSKPAATKTAPAKPAAKRRPAPAKVPVVAEPVLTTPDKEQLEAAELTHYGAYECEFNQSIDVGINTVTPGYVDVKYQTRTYTMKPVLSSTGALRLEDVRGQTLLLQIANKSMLMDVKAGKRMVDACVHEKQKNVVGSGEKLMN